MASLVDTGPIYADADATDAHHEECVTLFAQLERPLVVPMLVVTEVAYLLARHLGPEAELRFLGSLASGELIVEPVSSLDWERIAELVWQYRDLPLATVDASLVAAAERLGITTVATLDRRDFSIVRPAHVTAFDLVP